MHACSKTLAAALTAAVMVAAAGCGGSSDDEGGASGGGDAKIVGIAVGNSQPDWQPAQGEVAKALADQRGWKSVVLNNREDGPTALKNIDTFLQKNVDYVLQFQADSTVNPVISKKLASRDVAGVTYDIAGPNLYFVGVDNTEAGRLAGRALAQRAKQRWSCDVDLVLLGTITAAGDASKLRTDGNLQGVKEVCPDIADSAVVRYDSNGDPNTAARAARDVFSAHPGARKVLVLGVNDGAVVGALNAADQLGRGNDVIGWGQDGSLITGPDSNPQLIGSVLYFLEGYPVYAFDEILDKLAAGEPVEMGDTVVKPTVRVPPCPVTREQARDIPDTAERVRKLLAAPKGTTAVELFCPKGNG